MITTDGMKKRAISNIDKLVNENETIDVADFLDSVLKISDLIEKPIAIYGETVSVLNYRKKPKRWEEGVVREVSYSSLFEKFSWSYRVVLKRTTPKGKVISLCVGDNGLKRFNIPVTKQ